MKIHVRYFASVRESLGDGEEVDLLPAQALTVGALRDVLALRSAAHAQALSRLRPLRAALNHMMVLESAALSEGAEVAFFPPVTGG